MDDVMMDYLGCLLEDGAPSANQQLCAFPGASVSVAIRERANKSIADFTRWHAKVGRLCVTLPMCYVALVHVARSPCTLESVCCYCVCQGLNANKY